MQLCKGHFWECDVCTSSSRSCDLWLQTCVHTTQSLSCVDIWTTLISENTGLTCSASLTLLAEFPWPCPSFAGQENVDIAWQTSDAVCHFTIRITCTFICVACSLIKMNQKSDLLVLLLGLYLSLSVYIFSPACTVRNPAGRLKCNASTLYNSSCLPVCILFCVFIIAALYSTCRSFWPMLLFIRSEQILPDEKPAQVWDGSFILTGTISKYGCKKAIGR